MAVRVPESLQTAEGATIERAAEAERQALHPDSELDLCFLCDCTASMGQYIQAAQQNIQSIVTKISQHGAKVRFGLISYRDHPPQDSTYVTKVFPFTEDVQQMRSNVATMYAQGGGDGPEAVTAALYDALHMPWRPNATKICVIIADAPPHGLEPEGDGFPNGDPEGRDPLEILRGMAARDITVYSVGCEPALGQYRFARDFLCTVAEITGGQAVALSSAALLAEVIVNGSAEELELSKLQRQVEEAVLKVQNDARSGGRDITTEAAVRDACFGLQASHVTSVQMETNARMENRTKGCWGSNCQPKSLSAVKEELARELPPGSARPPAMPSMAPMAPLASMAMPSMAMASMPMPSMACDAMPPMAGYGSPAPLSAPSSAFAAPTNYLKKDLISEEQVSRLVQRAQCQNRLL